ncbi:MAG: HD-GYP domain-containing protein, partial [Rhodospirillaceae bacterium]|nr:HD-GYP domain-containing protein [Rhodospirillaceae bacterium]
KVLGSAIAKRDSDTHAHNFRVTVYAVRIAQAMGLDDGAIRSLIKGSFLHDVGKIAVPDAILLKPGKLDQA